MLDPERRQALDEAVSRFVAYGGILDATTRRYVAAWVQERLLPGYADLEGLQPGYFKHFSGVLDDVLIDNVLQDVTQRHPPLAAQIVIDLLGWFRRKFGEVLVGHPFESEESELQGWAVRPMGHVVDRWAYFTKALGDYSTRAELDPAYHTARVDALRSATPGGWDAFSEADRAEAGRLFDDLLAQWDSRLQAKILDFHLRRVTPLIHELAEQLHGKAREFKQLEELVEPFADYAGRYWDLSRDLWSDAGFDVIRTYRELLDREDELRKLAELLGRLREAELITEEEEYSEKVVFRSVKRDPHRRDELVGVFASDDLNRLLPSEAAMLGDDLTESVFLKRFASKDLQTYAYEHRYLDEHEGERQVSETVSRKKQRGPFIVCVDTSGSMEGLPERVAKVLCFGIMKMAAREERQAYLINFSTGIRTLDLLNIADSIGSLADFLQQSFHGGTDLSLALDASLQKLEEDDFRDADVLIISDFVMYKLDAELQRRMEYRRINRNTKFYGLIISDEPNEDVTGVFDRVWRYEDNLRGVIEDLR